MQQIDNTIITGVNYHNNTNPMHVLKTNLDKILPIVNQTLLTSSIHVAIIPILINQTCPTPILLPFRCFSDEYQ